MVGSAGDLVGKLRGARARAALHLLPSGGWRGSLALERRLFAGAETDRCTELPAHVIACV